MKEVTRRRFLSFLGLAAAGAAGWYAGQNVETDAEGATNPTMMKTWVLVDATAVSNIPVTAIKAAYGRARLGGISLAMPWDRVEKTKGVYDLSVPAAVADLARSLGTEFSLRVRGGSHTPAFWMGRSWVPQGTTPYDIARGMTIPCPFNLDGTKNTVNITGHQRLASQLARYVDAWGLTLLHGTWPGGPSAEMYYTPELTTLPGHSAAVVQATHTSVLYAWQTRIPVGTALEMPMGGMGGPPFVNLQKAMYVAERAMPRPQFIQLNWWDDRPTPAGGDTFTNFATRWPTPPRHGIQMIHAITMDYAKAFTRSDLTGAEYGEVYLKQFVLANSDQLVTEINKRV